jgi:hypothetical protein
MKMDKRGDFSVAWVIGIIISVLILFTVFLVIASFIREGSSAQVDFLNFVDTIENLKEGEEASTTLRINDEYTLISFNGKDFTPSDSVSCEGYYEGATFRTLEVPENCKGESCLCLCQKNQYSEVLGGKDCNNAPSQCRIMKTTFTDPDCSWGVYRSGSSSGAITVHYKKEEDIVSVCERKGCIAELEEETVEAFDKVLKEMEQCSQKEGDCSCSIDLGFLGTEYSMDFYEDKIELVSLTDELKYTKEVDFIAKDDSLKISLPLSLHAFTLKDVTFIDAEIGGSSRVIDESKSYWVLTPQESNKVLQAESFKDNQIKTNNILHKKENRLYLVDSDTSLNLDVSSCNELNVQAEGDLFVPL